MTDPDKIIEALQHRCESVEAELRETAGELEKALLDERSACERANRLARLQQDIYDALGIAEDVATSRDPIEAARSVNLQTTVAGDVHAALFNAEVRLTEATALLERCRTGEATDTEIAAFLSRAPAQPAAPEPSAEEPKHPECTMCHRPAACLGSYEGHTAWGYSCNVCCGHGNEDGVCFPLADIPDRYLALVKRLVDSEEEHSETAERAEAAESRLAELQHALKIGQGWGDASVKDWIALEEQKRAAESQLAAVRADAKMLAGMLKREAEAGAKCNDERKLALALLTQVRFVIDRVMAEDDEESGAVGLAEELDGIVPALTPAPSPGAGENQAMGLPPCGHVLCFPDRCRKSPGAGPGEGTEP